MALDFGLRTLRCFDSVFFARSFGATCFQCIAIKMCGRIERDPNDHAKAL